MGISSCGISQIAVFFDQPGEVTMQLSFSIEPEIENAVDEPQNETYSVLPYKTQLLKWIGNKQRFAHEIISFFPKRFGTYYEPFLGSGGVLGVLAPRRAQASDCFEPLIGIWKTLKENPDTLKSWYRERWEGMAAGDKVEHYEQVKASYNRRANPADFLYLSRAAYGGVMRFRKSDGYMSTPCGVHKPIHFGTFSRRVDEWHRRVKGTEFSQRDYRYSLREAQAGDLVYCDPPYSHSQAILYGAQGFSHDEMFEEIAKAKTRGVHIALSLDGTKKSGKEQCPYKIPPALFETETVVNCGRSMLRRFQMEGQTLEAEQVSDRLLLTY